MKNLFLLLLFFSFNTVNSQWKTGYYTDEFGDKTETTYKYLNAFGTFSNSATQGAKLMCELKISDSDALYITAYEYGDKLATFIENTWENVKLKSPDGKIHNFNLWFSVDGSLYFSDDNSYVMNYTKNITTENNYSRIMEVLKQKGKHKIIFNRTSDITPVNSSYAIEFTIK
jgi:hypothetical protein